MSQTMTQPIFLVGSERSGTTLLRLMLDHHPEIAFNLESEYMMSQVADDGAFPPMDAYRDWLARDRVFRHSRFAIDPDLDYVALLNDFLRQKRDRDGKRHVGATVHYHFSRLKWIWPDAKYIYLYRDGRDVARSVVQMGWAGNPYQAADWWLHAEREWESVRGHLPEGRWLEVRYEALIAEPRAELERICSFIGTKFDERLFDYTRDSSYEMPDPRLNYQWRKKMAPRDLRMVEAKIGTLLTRRGYELSGLPPLRVQPWDERLSHIQSRLATMMGRVRKFGLILFLRELVSRRLGLAAWNRSVMAEIDRVVDQGLR